MKKWFVSALLAVALPAQADIYKCMVDGTPTFQGWPCDGEPPDRSLSIIGKADDSRRDESAITRLYRHKAEAISNEMLQNMPGIKEHAARQERINRAIVERRLTQGMSEADARLIYGAPRLIERDSGGCRKLVWRNPDHAARVCFAKVSHVYY